LNTSSLKDILSTKSSITINAPAAKVWQALTTPKLIKQWFFGVDTLTDWKVNSPIIHKGVWQGKPYEDKGIIVKFDPPTLLAHTHWSAFSGLPDRAENYQTVTWELSEHDDHTDLVVAEVNLPSEQARTVSEQSWKTVLNALKEVVEK